MASLRKINGNYYAYFYDKNRDPKRKSYPLRVSLKSAAKKLLRRLEGEYADGAFDPWNPAQDAKEHLPVSEAVNRFLQTKSHLRERTQETYRTLLRHWARDHTPPGLLLTGVQPEHLHSYIWGRSDIAKATREKRYRNLRTFFGWATDEGHIEESPLSSVAKPKKGKKDAAFLSPADLKTVLRAIDAHAEISKDAAGKPPKDEWLKDMIRVAVCTGLRRGELLRLRWRDVDLDGGRLRVASREGEETKSGHERQLPLRGDALDVLRRMNSERSGGLDASVFTDDEGKGLNKRRPTKRFKFFVRKAKLPQRERLRFHSLRHTCGSWLAMKGVPIRVIQAILGHSSVRVTERYSHLQPEVMEKAMEETFG